MHACRRPTNPAREGAGGIEKSKSTTNRRRSRCGPARRDSVQRETPSRSPNQESSRPPEKRRQIFHARLVDPRIDIKIAVGIPGESVTLVMIDDAVRRFFHDSDRLSRFRAGCERKTDTWFFSSRSKSGRRILPLEPIQLSPYVCGIPASIPARSTIGRGVS